jgi:hypothetical protein
MTHALDPYEPALVQDSRGRILTVRRLTVLDRLRLFKAAGAVLAENAPWFGMAILAASVSAIDDVPVPLPTNEGQIEACVARLGDEGLSAVAAAIDSDDRADAETTAGNLRGTPT